ncbi:MAG: hypothetical protein L0I24_19980 [Pseudonocardia sp.]|nr:hypothetical protein [Pseudonocardia sp.]
MTVTAVRALAAAGALFALYPLARPYGDVTPGGAAAAFASPLWPVAHLAAVAAFVLAGVGIAALRTGRSGRAALAVWIAGAALVLPYYGAETYALHALAVAGVPDVPALAEVVRMDAVGVTAFGAGLVLLAAAGVLTAVAVGRAGIPFAVGMVLFLPQFFAEPWLRVGHGLLLGAGCLILAAALRARSSDRAAVGASG